MQKFRKKILEKGETVEKMQEVENIAEHKKYCRQNMNKSIRVRQRR
jgi:hypothetical protein